MRCLFVFDLVYAFFSLAARLIGPRTGCQFFKIVNFCVGYPLNSIDSYKTLVKRLNNLGIPQ